MIRHALVAGVVGLPGALVRYEHPGPPFWCWLHLVEQAPGRPITRPMSAEDEAGRVMRAVAQQVGGHSVCAGWTPAEDAKVFVAGARLRESPPIFESWADAWARVASLGGSWFELRSAMPATAPQLVVRQVGRRPSPTSASGSAASSREPGPTLQEAPRQPPAGALPFDPSFVRWYVPLPLTEPPREAVVAESDAAPLRELTAAEVARTEPRARGGGRLGRAPRAPRVHGRGSASRALAGR